MRGNGAVEEGWFNPKLKNAFGLKRLYQKGRPDDTDQPKVFHILQFFS